MERTMARPSNLDRMSYAQLSDLKGRVEKAMLQKKVSERNEVRNQLVALARKSGFDIRDLMDGRRGGKRGGAKGKVAPKYRDKSGNTWTGRGRMPRWMVAATKGGKAKKEDFLIK